MAYRFVVSVGGALLAAGMWVAVLAGAGAAAATPASGSDASASSNSAGATSDPDKPHSSASSSLTRVTNADHHDAAVPQTRSVAIARPKFPPAVPSARKTPAESKPAPTPEAAPETAASVNEGPQRESLAVKQDVASEAESSAAQDTAAVLAVAAPAESPSTAAAYVAHQPSVLDLVGTVVLDVFTAGFAIFAGPPQLPPGSTVTVQSSTLQLAPGQVVPADWYVPQDPNPDRLIYFQNGFIVNASAYSYTLAALAQNTDSIVVAPSISSNFFATDGFWLAGVPAQQAVANLFTGNRAALTASADAALGYPVTLPQDVVLTGHSYGAGTVLGAAADMVTNGTIGDLKGIVLLDGVPTQITADSALATIPDTIPVYDLASAPYFWNDFGLLSNALVAARPGQFTGVQLVNGVHVDSMQGGNPLLQLAGYLGTGFSTPANIDAVKTLASGWINDMFSGTHDQGIYAAPGATIQIPSDDGTATAIVPPGDFPPANPLFLLVGAIGDFAVATFFNFEPTEGPLALI